MQAKTNAGEVHAEADQVAGLFALLIIAGSLSAAVLFVLGGLGQ